MNTCEIIREFLSECDWDEAARQRAADALAHLQTCPTCAAYAADYDRIRSILKPEASGIPEGGWSAMERRLLHTTFHRRHWLRLPTLTMAMAAGLLIAIGYGIARVAMNRVPALPTLVQVDNPISQPANPIVGFFPKSDVAQEAKAFHEVSDVFEHRAAWLLVGDSASDMGVSDQPVTNQEQILLLRLTMLESGKIISSEDLAILPGQSANLTVPGDRKTSLRYRISTSDEQPTRLTISTQLVTPKGAEVLAALATTLRMEPGQKVSAGNMMTSSGNYELQIAFARADMERDEDRPTN
jgi:hypothetical protein